MTGFTELESAVLTMLLAGNHPVLEQLRKQLDSCIVTRREMTGVGFWTELDVGDAPGAQDAKSEIGDVVAEINGLAHGAGFVLFVRHGRLTQLEGFSYDEPWPEAITGYTLKYLKYDVNDRGGVCGTPQDERDWKYLEEELK